IIQKNIFNPKFSQEIGEEPNECLVNEFTKNLNELLKGIKDPRLAYHVLYASYEAEWIMLDLPVSPADTRVPSHSIFDHDYATASISNWLLDGKGTEGILLHIDLGGVQRFISHSRKLSDLWVSSYLASSLTWSIIWKFVRTLGPDVLILPTCRGNPFYYHSLIAELKGKVDDSVINRMKLIAGALYGYDPNKDGIPRYAVIPAKATLILPKLEHLKKFEEFEGIENLECLRKFVEGSYLAAWGGVYDGVMECCDPSRGGLGELALKARELLNECKRYGFDEAPPLPIRVIVMNTDELGSNVKSYVYHNMFKLLRFKEQKEKIYKLRPEEDLKLYDMTCDMSSGSFETWPRRSDRGFEYCSVCGQLPAVLALPASEDEYRKYLDFSLEPIFGMGERFCPYCLIKRLMSIRDDKGNYVLKSVMDKLIGEAQGIPKFNFPSVSDIALIPFKKSLITAAMKIDVSGASEVVKRIGEIWRKLKEKGIPEVRMRTELLGSMGRLEEKIEGLRDPRLRELKERLKEILSAEAERYFLATHRIRRDGREELYSPRREWRDLVKDLESVEDINTYYVIVRSDGDNMGRIIRGKIREGFEISVEEYLPSALEGQAAEIIKLLLESGLECAKSLYRKYAGQVSEKKIVDRLKRTQDLIDSLRREGGIMASPSYHAALSRALMASAVEDSRIVEDHDGVTIYAGGDDLLAVAPVKGSLEMVRKLREAFSFPSEVRGFRKFRKYLIPSLVTASRSFSIYIAHCMFPLYTALERSAVLLEDGAKRSRWVVGAGRKEKDSVILSYSPRGGEMSSVLSLFSIGAQDLGSTLRYVSDLLNDIESGEFSTSLIYDLHGNMMLRQLIKRNHRELVEMSTRSIFGRNCEVRDEENRRKKIVEWTKRTMGYYGISAELFGDKLNLLEQLFLALTIYRSGLRGVE
ncbi:MAG: type III-B CRISPR-associated protein Cas10/Cmr2, partial [Candidatus Korarchaeum sp.]